MCIISRAKGKAGRRDVIQCGICYGPVEMKGVGGGRLFNKVERVEEGGKGGGVGHADQCCKRIDLEHGSNCMN